MPVTDTQLSGCASAETIRTGLVGRGILASRSPWLHEQEARAQSLALSYELIDFSDRGWSDDRLGLAISEAEARGFAGTNITYPFKQAIIPLLDDLAPTAASVGAVNTVRFIDGRRIGYNTDVSGFASSVEQGLSGKPRDHVVQFGAGGAGSATAHGLLRLGATRLVLVDSDLDRAAALAQRLATAFPAAVVTTAQSDAELLAGADGVVNATPVGMAAHPGLPFDPDWLRPDMWVADIVYFPLETALLREARTRGCTTLAGRGMAVYQAAEAFDIFTGAQANRQRMLASFDAFVAGSAAS